MPATISISLTTGDTRAYVYPENANAAYVETKQDDILSSIVLLPRLKANGGR